MTGERLEGLCEGVHVWVLENARTGFASPMARSGSNVTTPRRCPFQCH